MGGFRIRDVEVNGDVTLHLQTGWRCHSRYTSVHLPIAIKLAEFMNELCTFIVNAQFAKYLKITI